MSTSLDLLRLLEPIVRPDGVGSPSSQTGRGPIESQGFDELLAQARTHGAAEPAADDDTSRPAEPTVNHPLGGVHRIENPSLRDLLARLSA